MFLNYTKVDIVNAIQLSMFRSTSFQPFIHHLLLSISIIHYAYLTISIIYEFLSYYSQLANFNHLYIAFSKLFQLFCY